MKLLIAIDSDDTLTSSEGKISDRTKKAITNLMELGNIIVVCTARPRYHTLKISGELGIKNFLVSSNGTEIYDNLNKKIIWSSYIDSYNCRKIYNSCQKNDIRIMFVMENTEYVTKFTRNNNQILLNDNNFNEVINGNVKQIMVIDSCKDKIIKLKENLSNNPSLNIVDSSDENNDELWFSIISNNSSKGLALKLLSDYLNIPLKNTIAIGNDKNDISMLEIAGISVVVENATNEVKKYADIITDSNDNDGVAKFLESLLKKNNQDEEKERGIF